MSRDSEERLYKNIYTKRPVLKQIPEDKSKGFEKYFNEKLKNKTEQFVLEKINKEQVQKQPKSKQLTDFMKGKTKSPFVYGATEYGEFNVTPQTTIGQSSNVERYKKEKRTVVSIDSANRNTYIYPDSNNFTIDLSRTFFNIKSIRLISSEFPNSERVVKDSRSGDAQNNVIEWINKEDISLSFPFTSNYYPFKPYVVETNSGNFSLATIDDEITTRLNNNVARLEGLGPPHFYVTETNEDNGVVSLSSYRKINLNSSNPVSTIYTQNPVPFSEEEATNKSFFVYAFDHGARDVYGEIEWEVGQSVSPLSTRIYNNILYQCLVTHTTSIDKIPPYYQNGWKRIFDYEGSKIYIEGVQSVGGIPASELNGLFTNFKVISPSIIQVFIDISCSFSDAGGGNTGYIAISEPYQLLFGDNDNNIGKVLGFPQENTSDYLSESYLVTTTFRTKDVVAGTKTTFYTEVVYIGNSISTSSGGVVTITTSIPHELSDGDEILIQNSDCSPSIDSFITDSYLDQVYYTVSVIDRLSFTITPGFDVTSVGYFCTIIFPNGDNQLLSTTVFDVVSIAPHTDPSYTVITTSTPHSLFAFANILLTTNSISGPPVLQRINSNFVVDTILNATQFTIPLVINGTFTSPTLVSKVKYGGDKVRIDNSQQGLYSNPTISGVFLVEDATPTSFAIDFETSYIDQTTIKFEVIESDVVSVYHPNHNFNRVVRSDGIYRFDIGCNRLTIQEDSGPKFSVVYPTGYYTTANIIGYLGPQLSALSPNSRTYTISFTGDIFTISISSGTFKIIGSDSNSLVVFRIPMVDTGFNSSFSGSSLALNTGYLLDHNIYGQDLKVLDVKPSATETLTADIWVGALSSDIFVGDGLTVDYVISNEIIFPVANEVYVNGVLLTDGVDYTYIMYSTTITFASAPLLGDDIEIKSVEVITVQNTFDGNNSKTSFVLDDDILDSSLVSVELFNPFVSLGVLTLGIDYTITLPRTIVLTTPPDIGEYIIVDNKVNDNKMVSTKPSGIMAGVYVYYGAPPSSYVNFSTYKTVNIPNSSIVSVVTEQDITGYTFDNTVNPMFYNSPGLLEANYYYYPDNFYNPSVTIEDAYTVKGSATYGVETILGAGDYFKLYRIVGIPVNSDNLLGISLDKINNNTFSVNKILNKDFYNFKIPGQYANDSSYTEPGFYMSSYSNGFSYKHDNTGLGANSNLGNGPYNALKLSGNNYVFLTSPGLETIVNTNIINDVFAKILLSEPPGNIIFNSFVANTKVFDEVPLAKLERLQFKVVGGDGFLYDFDNNDFSFSLEIVEYIDSLKNTGISSRTGSVDTSGQLDAIYTSNTGQQLTEVRL